MTFPYYVLTFGATNLILLWAVPSFSSLEKISSVRKSNSDSNKIFRGGVGRYPGQAGREEYIRTMKYYSSIGGRLVRKASS